MPSTSRCGVDSALPKLSRPLLSSNTAISVKVPPMSAASRKPLPRLPADDVFRLAMETLLLHSGGLRDRFPAQSLRFHEGRQLLGRHRLGGEGFALEPLLHR